MIKKNIISGILNAFIGILFLLFFITIGLHIALYYRPIYYSNINSISARTGYSPEDIKLNYDTLIDYCNPFYDGELKFPTFPSSENGLSHFAEVKEIFNFFSLLLIICPIILAVLIFIQHKRKVSSYLLTSPIIMIILPLIVFVCCLVDFSSTFTLFHELLFDNYNWYFNYLTDPVIFILPESFFLQCALILVISVLSGVTILLVAYTRQIIRRNQSQ